MARCAHQNGCDIDGAEQGGKEHAAVHAVDLRRAQGVIEGADALREYHIARKAGVADTAVTKLALLQDVPKGIDLFIHRGCRACLVALKAPNNAGVECLAQNLVYLGIVFIDIRGKENARIAIAALAAGPRAIVAQQALAHCAHGHCAMVCTELLPPKRDRSHYVDRLGLPVLSQFFVVPQHLGVNRIIGIGLGQNELGDALLEKGCGRQFHPDARICALIVHHNGEGRLGVAHVMGRCGRNQEGVGRSRTEYGGGEDIPTQLVGNLKRRRIVLTTIYAKSNAHKQQHCENTEKETPTATQEEAEEGGHTHRHSQIR